VKICKPITVREMNSVTISASVLQLNWFMVNELAARLKQKYGRSLYFYVRRKRQLRLANETVQWPRKCCRAGGAHRSHNWREVLIVTDCTR